MEYPNVTGLGPGLRRDDGGLMHAH